MKRVRLFASLTALALILSLCAACSQAQQPSAAPFAYEFAALPVTAEEPVLSISYLAGLAIVERSENVEWAKEFLRFTCQDEQLDQMASIKGVPCITRDGSSDSRFSYIDRIPTENRAVTDASDAFSKASESLAVTLIAIARGEVSTVKEAKDYYEHHALTHLELTGQH